jgi:hypothetical protein
MSAGTHQATAPHGGEGHETRDVSARVIVRWGVAVLLLVVFAGATMWPLLRFFEKHLAQESLPASPLASEYGPIEPPAPRLQVDPAADLAQLRAQEQAVLDGYGWVDRAQGTVRIPIDRAMALLAERRGGGAAR